LLFLGEKIAKLLDITKKIGKHKNGRYQPTKLSRQSVRTDERVAKGIIIVRHSVVRYWVSCVVGLREEESRTNQGNYLVSPDGLVTGGIIVRCRSRLSLVSEREKVVPTNETLVSPDVIVSFVAGLVRRWSQPERKGKELGQAGL
jgi:hypothetical protein